MVPCVPDVPLVVGNADVARNLLAEVPDRADGAVHAVRHPGVQRGGALRGGEIEYAGVVVAVVRNHRGDVGKRLGGFLHPFAAAPRIRAGRGDFQGRVDLEHRLRVRTHHRRVAFRALGAFHVAVAHLVAKRPELDSAFARLDPVGGTDGPRDSHLVDLSGEVASGTAKPHKERQQP